MQRFDISVIDTDVRLHNKLASRALINSAYYDRIHLATFTRAPGSSGQCGCGR